LCCSALLVHDLTIGQAVALPCYSIDPPEELTGGSLMGHEAKKRRASIRMLRIGRSSTSRSAGA
jgi:hypothetical protein